jgi:formyltetrahydrofolate-dependent phosphoribosylglycinamide formyltransferase
VSNKPDAGVLSIAKEWNIPVLILEKQDFIKSNNYTQSIDNHKITHIVLAGFLLKIPDTLIQKFPKKIINIHPALLPSFGGKGMYGENVHHAVIQAGEKKSGISIHLVDEEYDHGKTIFQESIEINPNETSESLANRIHQLEHKHYPRVIEKWASQ